LQAHSNNTPSVNKVAVVILNWNGMKMLEQFLPSVIAHSSNATIYVIDNASTDQSVKLVKEHFPSVHIIVNEENNGYSSGYNAGLKHIDAAYYVLLNSDVEVKPNWLEPIIKMMDEDRSIAACQPKILSYHDKSMFEYAGAAGGFIDKDGFMFCRGRIFNQFEKDEGQYDGVKEIFWASGACLFIRADLFHQIGGLDDDFFAHMEEIDLCWRLKNQGYRILFNSESVVYHVGGGTLSKNNPIKTYLNFRNNLYLLTKNYVESNFALKLFYRLILDGLAAFKFLLDGHPDHSWAILKAHFSFYKNFNRFYKKRRQSKLSESSYNPVGEFKRSIVFYYFVKRVRIFSKLGSKHFY
jgi:GT2 family glycosyltransferase